MERWREAVERVQTAIGALRTGNERPRGLSDDFWLELSRMTLRGWATALERDLRRADSALSVAAAVEGSAPSDDDVAALEECLWRLASATEKVDALIALAFDGRPFVLVADKPQELGMRPSPDRNKERLKAIDSAAALALKEARAALAGERARLRRHQVMHSLAPIERLDELGLFIRVHHRDGRIISGGYEPVLWRPARWNEGIRELTPETLFARRVQEARRALEALTRTVAALADALEADPIARFPQGVYFDHDTSEYALELPSPTGPPKRYEIDFIVDDSTPVQQRRVSSTSKVRPGEEITFDDGVWRVMRIADGTGGADQIAHCRLVENDV